MMNEPIDPAFSGRTAVIVAAEAIQAMHLQQVLRRVGIHVLETVQAENTAWRSVENHRPDFVLIDVEALSYVGAEVAPNVLTALGSCLILLSHLPEEQSRALASQWGAHGYLTKPMDREQILVRLQEAWPCGGVLSHAP